MAHEYGRTGRLKNKIFSLSDPTGVYVKADVSKNPFLAGTDINVYKNRSRGEINQKNKNMRTSIIRRVAADSLPSQSALSKIYNNLVGTLKAFRNNTVGVDQLGARAKRISEHADIVDKKATDLEVKINRAANELDIFLKLRR